MCGVCRPGAAMAAMAALVLAAGCAGSGEERVYGKDVDGVRPGPDAALAPGVSGERTYLIHFREPPLAMYRGGVPGLAAPAPARAGARLDANSAASVAYKRYLAGRQAGYLRAIARATGRDHVLRRYRTALDAVTMRLTRGEAARVARVPGVRRVEPDVALPVQTDRGPQFVGAPAVWDGSAAGVETRGEGMVIGIIDTGVALEVDIGGQRTHHPSFAAVDDDGYEHTSPLGPGVYLGGCAENPAWCNGKIIGVYSFLDGHGGADPAAPDSDPIWRYHDVNGHGSHVASIAAGNVRRDVPLYDEDSEPSKDIRFARISGVAPRAHIVSFKVCAPTCFMSDIAAAVEQAIEDGVVDVLNVSIGSPRDSPWHSSASRAFLSARAAGIFVAAVVNNDGPAPASGAQANAAPWMAAVGSSSHDRHIPPKRLAGLSGGATPPPADITGKGLGDGFTGRVVYAGDYAFGEPGTPGHDRPEKCARPFPEKTFAADMIVLCDRGASSRADKGRHVRAGGAGALILGNVSGGSRSLYADAHVIPAIHIAAPDADALRAWLATGTGHRGAITATGTIRADAEAGDILRASSGRGPFPGFDLLTPHLTAPGTNIYAAGSQTRFSGPGVTVLSRQLYRLRSGTSMASPFVAGAAALLKSLHPDWSDAEILSALMTTGRTDVRAPGGVTDPFDRGGGRIRVAEAARAGLVLDQSAGGFAAANPDLGGDPAALNVAALVQDECAIRCGWQREVTATTAGTWTVTGPDFAEVRPGELTLAAGDTRTLTVEVDVRGFEIDEFVFGEITLAPGDEALPVQRIPMAVRPVAHDIPRRVVIRTSADTGTRALGDHAITRAVDELAYEVVGLDRAISEVLRAGQDSDNDSPYDDISDGVALRTVEVPAGARAVIAEVRSMQARYVALAAGEDVDGNGLPGRDEQRCRDHGSRVAQVRCVVDLAAGRTRASRFWVLVHNLQASAPDARDSFAVATTLLGPGDRGNLAVDVPAGALAAGQPFALALSWNQAMDAGDRYHGRVLLYRDAARQPGDRLATVDVQIDRRAAPPPGPDAGVSDAGTPGGIVPQTGAGCGCALGPASPAGNALAWLLVAGLWARRRRRGHQSAGS